MLGRLKAAVAVCATLALLRQIPAVSALNTPLQGPSPTVSVTVASSSAFRLSVRFDGNKQPTALNSPSIVPPRAAPTSEPVAWGGMAGLRTSAGALLTTDDGSRWALYDAQNNTLVSASGAPRLTQPDHPASDGGVVLPVQGEAAAAGPGQACLGNGMFGPPHYWNRLGGYLAFAVSPMPYDPLHVHCYPASYNGTEMVARGAPERGARALVGSGSGVDTCSSSVRHDNADAADAHRSPKYPDGIANTTTATCCAACNSDPQCTAWVWADAAHPDASGMNCWPLASASGTVARQGRTFGGATPPPPPPPPSIGSAWWVMGDAADVYLAPTGPQPRNYTRAFFELSGAPLIPPLYGLGFMATYWGYDNMLEVESNMTAFRSSDNGGPYPIDSFIMDYDWWKGAESDLDFGYAPKFWANNTYPSGVTAVGAKANLDYFHDRLHMHFGGIRKPRTYSNQNLSAANGWLLPNNFSVGAGGNNWNTSTGQSPDWTAWYTKNHLHFLHDGIDFWWNDEGETQWFTYSWWNEAQTQQYATMLPNQRHFTINRAFQPGMQRYPAVTWTGDRQDCSHATVLEFVRNGQPWVACDMTSPDATVLVRQYQNAVFLSIMRVHQMHGTPRFPYLWGTAEHHTAFREALELRYHLLPHLVSLAHRQFSEGIPLIGPASYVYPNETWAFEEADSVLMMGDSIVPGVVCTDNSSPSPTENTTTVSLPPGLFFRFNSTSGAQTGPKQLTLTDVPLNEMYVYIRSGSILVLQRDVVQYASLIGGVLELHVYAGSDASFKQVEDDGTTLNYVESPSASTRVTQWTWDDATRTLSWTVSGGFNGGTQLYTQVEPRVFSPGAAQPATHAAVAIGDGGSLTIPL